MTGTEVQHFDKRPREIASRTTNQGEMLNDSHDAVDEPDAIRNEYEDNGQLVPEHDSRENLEADVMKYLCLPEDCRAWGDFAEAKKWLDRQAVITERECIDTRINFAERMRFVSRIDELQDELAKRDKGIERLKARRDDLLCELKVASAKNRLLKAHISKMQDGRHGWHLEAEALKQRVGELKAELEARETYPDGFVPHYEMVERMGRLEAENAKLAAERDYWKREMQSCMDAAYPPSHAPERPYNPNVMGYPDRDGCTTPSTLVCDVIHGLRDEKMAEWKGLYEQLSKAEAERVEWKEKALHLEHRLNMELACSDKSIIEALESANRELDAESARLKAERDRYRELAGELLDVAHNMQLIADRGLA